MPKAEPDILVSLDMLMGRRDAIESQEARGLDALVKSADLPINAPWDIMAQWGIVRGEDVDDIFTRAALPEGWSKVPTHPPYWSEVRDEKGRARLAVFYKAAFYDRSAHATAEHRYRIEDDRYCADHADGDTLHCRVLGDGGAVLFECVFEHRVGAEGSDFQSHARRLCKKWLDENIVEWAHPVHSWLIEPPILPAERP